MMLYVDGANAVLFFCVVEYFIVKKVVHQRMIRLFSQHEMQQKCLLSVEDVNEREI